MKLEQKVFTVITPTKVFDPNNIHYKNFLKYWDSYDCEYNRKIFEIEDWINGKPDTLDTWNQYNTMKDILSENIKSNRAHWFKLL